LAIAALLHDSVEDQGGKARLEDVRNRFGDRVARVVAACSDSLADTAKGERKADWQKRKEAYLSHLDTADDDVLRVSLAVLCFAICASPRRGPNHLVSIQPTA
jgi:(p)ppGpp synthase/HD superfamily hydrolase